MFEASLTSLCKINLFLKVLRKRSDGYHEIETLFLPLSEPCDIVSIEIKNEKGISISSNLDDIPCNCTNTCWKAAELFAKFAKIEPEWHIHIEKKIPIAAGLGGGSGNAAAVLKILNGIYKTLNNSQLAEIAVSVGADVPFFINPQPFVARGIGEKIENTFACPDFGVILVNPLFPVSAAWAYKNRLPAKSDAEIRDILEALKTSDIAKIAKYLRNDLAPALYEKFPLLDILREDILSAGAVGVEITGSGPTLFGITDSKLSAQKMADLLKSKFGDAINCFATHPAK